MHYFQVEAIKYTHTGFEVEQAGAVAFRFFMSRDGGDTFEIPVLFSTQVLNLAGKSFSLGIPFLQEPDKPKFLKYGFYRLKRQLEESNLDNCQVIVIDRAEGDSVKRDWPKQCDFLIAKGEDLFCSVDASSPAPASLESCGKCGLPETVFRCDRLSVQGVSGSDRDRRRQVTPRCVCSGGYNLPKDFGECTRQAGRQCFIPFRFYLRPPKYPSGFAAPPQP